jgi:hypothetical protein
MRPSSEAKAVEVYYNTAESLPQIRRRSEADDTVPSKLHKGETVMVLLWALTVVLVGEGQLFLEPPKLVPSCGIFRQSCVANADSVKQHASETAVLLLKFVDAMVQPHHLLVPFRRFVTLDQADRRRGERTAQRHSHEIYKMVI